MYSVFDFPFKEDNLKFPGVIPSNAGMGTKVKVLVEQYAHLEIKEFEEALVPQGIEITLFNKIITNRNRTCSSNINTVTSNNINNTIEQQEINKSINNITINTKK